MTWCSFYKPGYIFKKPLEASQCFETFHQSKSLEIRAHLIRWWRTYRGSTEPLRLGFVVYTCLHGTPILPYKGSISLGSGLFIFDKDANFGNPPCISISHQPYPHFLRLFSRLEARPIRRSESFQRFARIFEPDRRFWCFLREISLKGSKSVQDRFLRVFIIEYNGPGH